MPFKDVIYLKTTMSTTTASMKTLAPQLRKRTTEGKSTNRPCSRRVILHGPRSLANSRSCGRSHHDFTHATSATTIKTQYSELLRQNFRSHLYFLGTSDERQASSPSNRLVLLDKTSREVVLVFGAGVSPLLELSSIKGRPASEHPLNRSPTMTYCVKTMPMV